MAARRGPRERDGAAGWPRVWSRSVEITQPVQANAVFAILPAEATVELQREFKFYVWNEHTGEVRWMCSWDTTEEDVDAFVAAILDVVAEGAVAGGEHRGL